MLDFARSPAALLEDTELGVTPPATKDQTRTNIGSHQPDHLELDTMRAAQARTNKN